MVTVPSENTYAVFSVTSSSTGPFAFDFPYFAKTDLEVWVDEAQLGQADFTLSNGSGSATAGYDGGSVTLVTAVANSKVSIIRNVIAERSSNLSSGGLTGTALNAALNKQTMHAQDRQRDAERALRIPPDEDVDSCQLPSATDRASKTLTFDSSGDVQLISSSGVATIAASIGDVILVAADLAGDDNIGTVAADLSGSDTIGSAAALVGAGSPGIPAITGAGAVSLRSVVAGSGSITVANGTGAAGNIAIDTAQDIRSTASPAFAGLSVTGAPVLGSTAGYAQVGSSAGNYARHRYDGALSLNGGAYALVARVSDSITVFADADQTVRTTDSPTFAGASLTGNLTTTALIDGRDVAADGTKLDGIESGATADQTGAEIKALYEAEADTNAFTDADHTKLDGIEASADVTDFTNVAAAGAVMDGDFSTNGFAVRTAAGAYTNRSITGGTGVTVNDGDGVAANPEIVIGQAVAVTDAPTFSGVTASTGNDAFVDVKSTGTVQSAIMRITGRQSSVDNVWNVVSSGTGLGTSDLRFVSGGWTGAPEMALSTSGALTITGGLVSSGLTYPTSDGTAGQFLTTNGAGTLSFATPAGGGDVLKAANETVTGSWEFTNNLQVTEGAVRWLYQSGNAAAHSNANHGSIGIGVTDGGNVNGVRVVNHDDPDNAIYNSQTIIFSTGKGGVSVGNDWFAIDPSGRFTGDESTSFPAGLPARAIYSPTVISDSREIDPDAYGAVSDLEWYDGAATIDIGSNAAIVTMGGGVSVPSWVTAGTVVVIRNAGTASAAPGSSDKTSHYTTVASRDSASQITLASGAGASVSAERIAFMTDNTTAITAAVADIPTHGGRLIFKGQAYHTPPLSFANKRALEIMSRGRVLLMGSAEAQTLLHVQASCSEVGIDGVTLGGLAATRDRVNGRFSGVNCRFDASDSEIRSLSSFGAADFGIFVGQDESNLTNNVTMLGGRSYENVGDGYHFGHLERLRASDLHARANGDDNFGLVGYESATAPLKDIVLNASTAEGGDYRGLLIKHSEDVTVNDFVAKNCGGAGIEVNVFRDDSGAKTGFLSHYNDEIRIKGGLVKDCAQTGSSAGIGLYHTNEIELENVSVRDSGSAGVNECSNIIIFNTLSTTIRGGKNTMSRAGGGQGIFYWNTTAFEGRDHRSIETTYDTPDAGSTEQISINDVDFRMEVSVAGRYDIYLLPDAGSAGGQDGKIDKLAAVTITGNRSASYKGDQVGAAQCVIKVNPDKVDFLDVGQTSVRNAADDGTETVGSNRNVFGHGIDLT